MQHCHPLVPKRWALVWRAIGDGTSAQVEQSLRVSPGLQGFVDGISVVDFGLIQGDQIKISGTPQNRRPSTCLCAALRSNPKTLKIPRWRRRADDRRPLEIDQRTTRPSSQM